MQSTMQNAMQSKTIKFIFFKISHNLHIEYYVLPILIEQLNILIRLSEKQPYNYGASNNN